MARTRAKRERVSARRRVDTHDTGGGSNYLRVPEGFSFFQVKPGKYRLDFMCYRVTKGKGEQGGNPFFETGELGFERTFYIHRGIGPNEDWHLCAAKTFGQPCPVCEYRSQLARDPNSDEQVIKDLAPKERQLWLPKDLADPDQKYIWEYSYHLFGKQLDAKIRSGDEEDGYDYFADPTDGLTVRVNFEQSDRGKWVEATDIEFKSRREQYDEDVVDEMPDLDAMLVATPYDKLKALFLQTGEAEEDEPAPKKKPAKKERGRRPPDDTPTAEEAGLEEGDLVLYKGEDCEIVRISGDGTSLTLEDEDGETIKPVGVNEVEKPKRKSKAAKPPADDDDDEPTSKKKPPKKKPPKKVAKKPPVDEDDDWDDDEEEEEPAPKKPAKKKPPVDDDDDDWD